MSGYWIAAGAVVGIWVFAVAVFLLQARDAVLGWQDENGFHEGVEPEWGWPTRIDDERNN